MKGEVGKKAHAVQTDTQTPPEKGRNAGEIGFLRRKDEIRTTETSPPAVKN